jgi:hypothetical protein
MRTVLGGILLVAVFLGIYVTISTSIAKARDVRPATFAERFAAVMPSASR